MDSSSQNSNFLGGYYSLENEKITKATLFFKDKPRPTEVQVTNGNVDMEEIKKIFAENGITSQ